MLFRSHVTNSGVQIQIFEALGARVPLFAHHSLLVGPDGQTLSKRLGSLSIEGMRADGIEPLAVACHAALVGTSGPTSRLWCANRGTRAPRASKIWICTPLLVT